MNLYAETAPLQGKPGEPYHRLQLTYYYLNGATVHRLKQTKSWMKADLYLFQLVTTEKQISKRISWSIYFIRLFHKKCEKMQKKNEISTI